MKRPPWEWLGRRAERGESNSRPGWAPFTYRPASRHVGEGRTLLSGGGATPPGPHSTRVSGSWPWAGTPGPADPGTGVAASSTSGHRGPHRLSPSVPRVSGEACAAGGSPLGGRRLQGLGPHSREEQDWGGPHVVLRQCPGPWGPLAHSRNQLVHFFLGFSFSPVSTPVSQDRIPSKLPAPTPFS